MLFKITSLFYAYPRAPFSASFYALESLDVQLYFFIIVNIALSMLPS